MPNVKTDVRERDHMASFTFQSTATPQSITNCCDGCFKETFVAKHLLHIFISNFKSVLINIELKSSTRLTR